MKAKVQTTLRIPKDLIERADALSEGATRSEVLRVAILLGIRKLEKANRKYKQDCKMAEAEPEECEYCLGAGWTNDAIAGVDEHTCAACDGTGEKT